MSDTTSTDSTTSTDAIKALTELFPDAKVKRTSEVEIPAELADKFTKAIAAFASVPNTYTLTETFGDHAAAVKYGKQIRQFAASNNRTARATVDGTSVTWRFSKITPGARGKSRKTNPVKVTQGTPTK